METDTHKIYVDGKDLATTVALSNADTLFAGSADVLIGGIQGSGLYFPGIIDNVRLYDYARTSAQIAWEYNRGAPMAYYKFDECQGTTINDWGPKATGGYNGNTGTLTIGATIPNSSAGTCSSGTATEAWNNGTTGKRNSAISLDGVDDYMATASGTTFGFTDTTPFSVSAWVKPENTGAAYKFIVGYMTPNVDDFAYALQFGTYSGSYDRLVLGLSRAGVGTDFCTGSTTISNSTWYHVTGTYDGTNMRVYLNGKLDCGPTANTRTGTNQGTAALNIGRRSDINNNYLQGLVDDVKIYNYTLTPNQVKLDYNDGAVRFD